MSILVVDDSKISRRIIREELEAGGYDVVEAASGPEALEAVRTFTPELITMDVDMAVLDGFQTSTLLRSTLEEKDEIAEVTTYTPIIFITGRDSLEMREKGFQAGGTDFITKPFPSGFLLERANTILNPPGELSDMTALIVDDSEVALIAVRDALKRIGLKTISAKDGKSGLELARAHAGNVHLIVLDYMMPGMNGDELCTSLRKMPEYMGTPIIMLSALSERSYILRMFEAGATDYLIKPFVGEELIARVNSHLHTYLLNQKLAEKLDELQEINQGLNEMLAVTSHDLRSPLMTILGYFQLALEGGLEEEMKGFYRTRVENSLKHITSMLDDLTQVSRLTLRESHLIIGPVDVHSLAHQSMGSFEPTAQLKEINLHFENHLKGIKKVLADPTALLRVLNNLIANAIKFSYKDGSITVTLENGTGSSVRIRVADTGTGIDPDLLPNLFDLKRRETRTGTAGEPGTGIGLAISKKLMLQMDGTLNLESTPGQGVQVTLTLPSSAE